MNPGSLIMCLPSQFWKHGELWVTFLRLLIIVLIKWVFEFIINNLRVFIFLLTLLFIFTITFDDRFRIQILKLRLKVCPFFNVSILFRILWIDAIATTFGSHTKSLIATLGLNLTLLIQAWLIRPKGNSGHRRAFTIVYLALIIVIILPSLVVSNIHFTFSTSQRLIAVSKFAQFCLILIIIFLIGLA